MGGQRSGRRPKPTALKVLMGNPGRRPLNRNEPKVEHGAPTMPKYLDRRAREKWEELVPMLLSMKVLTKSDGEALAGLCCAFSQFVGAYKLMRDMRANNAPSLVRIASDADKRLRSYYAMFGLDPSSRSKLNIGPAGRERDDLESFLDDSLEDVI